MSSALICGRHPELAKDLAWGGPAVCNGFVMPAKGPGGCPRITYLAYRENDVSTIKNPEEKKHLSLERDRRNRYGENSKSSRKSIQRGKQRRHMDERRTVGEVLGRLKGNVEEDDATQAEFLAKTRITDSQRRGFKKKPDTPLGVVLEAKRERKKSKKPQAADKGG